MVYFQNLSFIAKNILDKDEVFFGSSTRALQKEPDRKIFITPFKITKKSVFRSSIAGFDFNASI